MFTLPPSPVNVSLTPICVHSGSSIVSLFSRKSPGSSKKSLTEPLPKTEEVEVVSPEPKDETPLRSAARPPAGAALLPGMGGPQGVLGGKAMLEEMKVKRSTMITKVSKPKVSDTAPAPCWLLPLTFDSYFRRNPLPSTPSFQHTRRMRSRLNRLFPHAQNRPLNRPPNLFLPSCTGSLPLPLQRPRPQNQLLKHRPLRWPSRLPLRPTAHLNRFLSLPNLVGFSRFQCELIG